MKKKQSNLRTSTVYERFYFIYKTTLHYCLNCRKIQKVKFQKLQRQIKKKIMLLSKPVVCDSKKLRFIKEKTASGFVENIEKVSNCHLVSSIKRLVLKLILKISKLTIILNNISNNNKNNNNNK